MTIKDYYSFESKQVRGEEGTIISIEKESDNMIRVRWETDEYECAMYVTKEGDIWETSNYDSQLETWSADGPFQDYSDDNIYDFVEEGITTWANYIQQ